MSDRQQASSGQQDTPERRQRVAGLLLKLSPLMFVLSYVLAAVQGARWRDSLLIAVVGTLMCLGAAGLYKLRGAKSADDALWISIILRLFSRRRSRHVSSFRHLDVCSTNRSNGAVS